MKITFLGTGTSQGVPIIGCECAVCQSRDKKDKRLRTSALVELGDKVFVIDVGPDFRQQLLSAKVKNVTAILVTHEHNDHIIGLDDVRPLNFITRNAMPVYAEKRVQDELRGRFPYIFDENPYPGAPSLSLQAIDYQNKLEIEGCSITPIRAWHGSLPVLGFRFGDFTFLTDINRIDAEELEKVKGTTILALDALHHELHHSHLSLDEAIELAKKIGAKKTYFIHCSHRMGLTSVINKKLPKNMKLAYDGLTFEL